MTDASKGYLIKILTGPQTGVQWTCSQSKVSVGRGEDNDIILSNPTVSKTQCRIVFENGCLGIENVSTSNPTCVNGTPVEHAPLADGDTIQVGNLELGVEVCLEAVEIAANEVEVDDNPATAATMFVDEEFLRDALDGSATMETQSVTSPSDGDKKYSIKSKLAQSGQAILFHGYDETSGEEVALKLFTHDTTDEVSEARFRREIQILERLSHSNIVEYRGVFEAEGEWGDTRKYLVMEYLHGKNLKEYMKEYPKGIPWDKARDIFEQCLRGLTHAWDEHGIVHRDIKPSNIFILEDGSVKLIDFGISRVDSETTHTGGSGMMGSFDYMAPDFALHTDPGFRGDMVSDIYSLFACFYEALTGTLPYPKYGERQELEYLNRWKEGAKTPSHKHIVFRVVAHLSRFIDKGLSVGYKDRYQSFKEVLDELRGLKNRVIIHRNVDEYALIDGLGAGGFGEVYLGRRKSDKELVAVKRLYSNRPSKRFAKEAAVLRKYAHPAIVNYLDYFETESSSGSRSSVLVLQYLEGLTLNRSVAAHPHGHESSQVLQMFLQYLSALDFLHNAKNPIIHRDIKPSNLHVPLENPLEARIFDMGIVKDVSGTQTTGKLPGTFFYMAPEMFTSNNRGTPQTDIYALGLSLYEALTGSPAYPRLPKNDKEAIVEMVARAQGKKELRISYRHDAFKQCPDLVNIIQQATHPDPAARYASAARMWEDVAEVLVQHFEFSADSIAELRNTTLTGTRDEDLTRFLDLKDVVSKKTARKKKKKKHRVLIGFFLIVLLLTGAGVAAWWKYPYLEPYLKPYIGEINWQPIHSFIQRWKGEPQPVPEPMPEAIDPPTPVPEPIEPPASTPIPEPTPIEPEKIDVVDLRQRLSMQLDLPVANSYDDMAGAYSTKLKNYSSIMMDERSVTPELYALRRQFWKDHISDVLDGIDDGDVSLAAIANGLFVAALPSYAEMEDSSDLDVLCSALFEDIDAESLTDLQAAEFFPFRRTLHFNAMSSGNDPDTEWLEQLVTQDGCGYEARYLPFKARLELQSEREGYRRDSILDFALVPFGVMPEAGQVAGPPLPQSITGPFYMATREITLEDMRCYKDSNGDQMPELRRKNFGGTGPYTGGTVDEAIEFCNWLSRYDGLPELYTRSSSGRWEVDLRKPGYRLPFEHEWEYAARFGYDFHSKPGCKSWQAMKADLEETNTLVVHYFTQPEDLREPDHTFRYPLGLHDLCGNAPEICMASTSLSGLPSVASVGFTLMHGGVSAYSLEKVMPWARDEVKPGKAEYGFRVVRSLPFHDFKR